MNKNIISETARIKSLFNYQRGKVISEQFEMARAVVAAQKPAQDVQTQWNQYFANDLCLADLKIEQNEIGGALKYVKIFNDAQGVNHAFVAKGSSPEGDYWKAGNKVGTWRCGGDGTVIVKDNGKEVTLYVSSVRTGRRRGGRRGSQNTTTTTQTSKYQLPTELNTVDKVKKFQSWLDKNRVGWHRKYQTLGDDPKKGWGRFGPNTFTAWDLYKQDYLDFLQNGTSQPKKLETPDLQMIDKKISDIVSSTKQVELPKNVEQKIQQQIQQQKPSPEQVFNTMVQGGLIDPLVDADGNELNRIKYKGVQPTQEILTQVDDFLKQKGFNRIKSKEKGYGVKYVWQK